MADKPPGNTAAAGLLAPLAGAFYVAVVAAAAFSFGSSGFDIGNVFMAYIAWANAAIGCFVVTWTCGLVWHMLAKRIGAVSWFAYATVGACIGSLLALPFIGYALHRYDIGPALLLLFASTGVVAALTGWFIRRPDRDAQQ